MPTIDQVLGFGLIQPFRFDGKTDFAAAGGLALVQSSIEQIIQTMCDDESSESGGELLWDTEFGARVNALRHRQMNPTLREMAKAWITDAIARYEPRVRIQEMTFEVRDDGTGRKRNVLFIALRYDIVANPRAGNAVVAQGISQVVAA